PEGLTPADAAAPGVGRWSGSSRSSTTASGGDSAGRSPGNRSTSGPTGTNCAAASVSCPPLPPREAAARLLNVPWSQAGRRGRTDGCRALALAQLIFGSRVPRLPAPVSRLLGPDQAPRK